MTLGENIARLRAERRLSQGDLADALGVSRQSVSKWETDASVPELDKLVRLSELFGVTLDRLVKGEAADEELKQELPPPVPAEGTCHVSLARTVTGGVLLAVGLLGLLTVLFFCGPDGLLPVVLLLSVPVLCGIICLKVRRRAGIWCAWTVYATQQIYWTHASGVTWKTPFWTTMWVPGMKMSPTHLIIFCSMLLAMVGLLVGTLWSFRNTCLAPILKSRAMLVGAGMLAVLCLLVPDFLPIFGSYGGAVRGGISVLGLAALTVVLSIALPLRRYEKNE